MIILSNFASFFSKMKFISYAIDNRSIDIKNKDNFKATNIDIESYDANTSYY